MFILQRIKWFLFCMVLGFATQGATAQEYKLRFQAPFPQASKSGKLVSQFVEDVQVMSGNRVEIEMFWSSSLVNAYETFDSAVTGLLDGDFTSAAYQINKNPAFQFVSDIMGGYDTPWQQYAWLYHGHGLDIANKLYNAHGMQLIGWRIFGQHPLSSVKPLRGPADLKDWKFRSPPGLETEIFAGMGASPVEMKFTEISAALESGIIEGADATILASNVDLGLYGIVSHATYPGFHSMPSDHLAINKTVWDGLPDDIRRIIEVAMEKTAFQTALTFEVANNEAAAKLKAAGVTLHNWSAEDRGAFRETAQAVWQGWAEKTPEARALVDSHMAFLRVLGLAK